VSGLRETTYRKALAVETDPPLRSNVMWVMVDQVRQPKSQWIYLLSEEKPDTPEYRSIRSLRIPTDKLCHSYTELCAWLKTLGCQLPSPDYFTPTREELDEGVEWIIRPVTRLR
jgi:hypothetical protein